MLFVFFSVLFSEFFIQVITKLHPYRHVGRDKREKSIHVGTLSTDSKSKALYAPSLNVLEQQTHEV
jgi:hypothetical protein